MEIERMLGYSRSSGCAGLLELTIPSAGHPMLARSTLLIVFIHSVLERALNAQPQWEKGRQATGR
jgi:hypothetical protein